MEKVIAIIPAAGKATRLGLPYPKELLPITHDWDGHIITILESNLRQLYNAECYEANIVINADKRMIADYIGHEKYGISINYPYQLQKLSREGLPDAVWAAQQDCPNGDIFLMLMGDVYFTDPELVKDLLDNFRNDPDSIAMVAAWETNQPERFGVLSTDDDFVTSVMDKPKGLPTPQLFWGAIAFREKFWEFIGSEQDTMSNALNRACKEYQVSYIPAYGMYIDIGTARSLIEGIVQVNS